MAFTKLLPQILKPRRQTHSLSFPTPFSFSTPAAASTARRRRRLLLGMPPPSPLPSLPLPPPPSLPPPRKPQPSPSIPKLPDPPSSLSAPRLHLHNTILSLLVSGDLREAAALVRHSVYSNCRPTIFTVNAVLAALLAGALHADLLALHRFVNQAGIVPTIVTHNLVIQSYVDSGKLDVALTYYRFIAGNLPLLPSPTTFRILVKALLADSRIDDAVQIKDEMIAVIEVDLEVYSLIMGWLADNGDPDRALVLYQELREKLGENPDSKRIVSGSLMNAYFRKGMERAALDLYDTVIGEEDGDCRYRFSADSRNSVLDVLCKNGKFEEAAALFEKMMADHCPPVRLSVDLRSFTVMVDACCASGRFKDAIDVFRKVGEKKISADTLYYNNLINKVGEKGMVVEAEEIYREMRENGVKPNEQTYVFLMEGMFGAERTEDATRYLSEMADAGIEPGTLAYNAVLCGLVKAEKLDEARVFFDQMIMKEVKRDLESYEVLLKAFCEFDRLDHLLAVVRALLMDSNVVFRPDILKLVEDAVKRGEMEEELKRLFIEVEKEKEEELVLIAEKKARLDALDREERLGKRAEAKAKQAATTKITKEHIEMHIKRYALSKEGEKKDEPELGGMFSNGGLSRKIFDDREQLGGIFLNGLSKQVSDDSVSSQVLKVGDEDAAVAAKG